MAQSSKVVSFEMSEEIESPVILDNTCPECGAEAVVSYIDRYSEYEYCTGCDWSDADEDPAANIEPISRRDRWREEA